jgi:hypothetical protein
MDAIRNGNFTSSGIAALMAQGKTKGSFGVPALTYIDEKNMERRLERSITAEIGAHSLLWGTLCEPRAFSILSTSYKLCSSETLSHPDIEFWKGSPDAEKFDEGKTVCDIKCPITLKSFCQFVDSFARGGIDEVRDTHKDGEKYYWQVVSNAVLTKAKYGEIIVYCPYESELQSIRLRAEGNPKYYWVWGSLDEELPYLRDGGFYKNINVLRFEIPVSDKIALHERVVEAGKMLVPIKILTAV